MTPNLQSHRITKTGSQSIRRSNSRKEDSKLIRSALAGNQDAYKRLMDKYREGIFVLINRMISDKNEALDLTQETFLKAFGSLSTFNHKFAFSTWLYKIASNTCIDHLRKKKLRTFSIDQSYDPESEEYTYEVPDRTFEPDREIIGDQRRTLIHEAIESLPVKYRKVIKLRHLEEKNYDEISNILKLPLGTVKAHIFRGRELLNKYLRKKLREF